MMTYSAGHNSASAVTRASAASRVGAASTGCGFPSPNLKVQKGRRIRTPNSKWGDGFGMRATLDHGTPAARGPRYGHQSGCLKFAAPRPLVGDLSKHQTRHALRSGERLLPGLGVQQVANLRARFSREQRIDPRGVFYAGGGIA